MKTEAASALAIALALQSNGCSKKYMEIEVRDPGRVAVGVWDARGAAMVLPADGSQRVAPLPVPGVVAMRGRDVAIGWGGGAPVTLVDERGILPRTPPPPVGVEVRGRTLWAAYNVTPNGVLPQHVQTDESVPVVLSTDMSNVVDAREVREVRHWPGYVCVSTGAVLSILGAGLLASKDSSEGVGGAFYLAASVPLLIYGVINLTSSNDAQPLYIPGAPPR